MEEGGEEQHRLVTAALRLALAEKLELEPAELEGLDPETAAAALQHFVQLALGPERLEDWVEAGDPDDRRADLVGSGVRQALAYELGVQPHQLDRMNLLGAAHALDRIRNRRLSIEASSEHPGVRGAAGEERPLIDRVINESLAEQLEVPVEVLASLTPNLAAHILATLIALRRRTRLLALPSATEDAPATPDRRNLVARVVRDSIAHDTELHPRLFGSLEPAAAAVLLGHFVQARRMLEGLRINVVIDELTDALRRSAGELELEQEIARIQRHGGDPLAVAFLDVDALKIVNDNLGHGAGDELLQALVGTVRGRLRNYDSIVRWGGDEFLVILPQTDVDAAAAIMARIWTQFKEARGQTFSYGLAAYDSGGTVAELVARADAALYERKRSGSGIPAQSPNGAADQAFEGAATSSSMEPAQTAGRWLRFRRWLSRSDL